MTHHRLAAHAIAAGDPIDAAPYTDEYECDGCGKRSSSWQSITHVQGQAFRGGAQAGFLAGDFCADCWAAKPMSAITKGLG